MGMMGAAGELARQTVCQRLARRRQRAADDGARPQRQHLAPGKSDQPLSFVVSAPVMTASM